MQVKDIISLIRPNIRDLTPYRSARDDFDQGILLDANENSLGAPVKNNLELNRYPVPTQDALRKKIAEYRKVQPENICLGVGSDEPIDLLIRIFCEPAADAIVVTPPTYGMYSVSARINNVDVQKVRMNEQFQPDTDAIIQKAGNKTKILFLCSPNNPTGNDLDRTKILELIERFPGIVVVDEAYIDFSKLDSLAPLTSEYPNLVVLQTFSKAFGLAGIRLGIAISNPEIIQYMMNVKAPYNVNKLTADTALKAFENIGLININVSLILQERDILVKQLGAIPSVKMIYPSDANFLLFRIPDALNVYKMLAGKGIIIRYRGNEPGCENCLRVTIGTPDENKRFLNALKELVS